ncbi:Betaine aldehyde dehydrogenase [Penicillium angulare]|uniref:Betaine aldehyde dehydrogenase n=1 Tax=Penicillium angulare TaxID=116970 RepID=UPI002541DA15|nr:Betaine aldehyde dehydrogenase [Penicillium angulare]KAJ5291011.1 Betaine aldehyde dehydrogenase [Penicillium angulare]
MASLNFETYHNVINGALKSASKQYYGINPFTEERLWPVPVATEEDLEEAIEAANIAFKTWKNTTLEDRLSRFQAFANALLAQKSEWADLVSKEAGQSIEFATDEVEVSQEYLTTIPNIDLPEYVTHDDEDVKVTTKYYPLGVVAGICPWNFPVLLAAGKIASAVSTGNTIIIKPSPYTPYSELKLAELAQQFFPPGVIQALGGDDNLGPWMTKHPGIAKISFTGSTATGKKIMAAAASTLKRVTLELGGNDPSIVCPDIDLDAVIPKILEDVFTHSGQSCIDTKRIYVHKSIYDTFLSKFTAASKKLKLGHGYLSPLQNKMQYEKVASLLKDCQDQKYEFALGEPREKSLSSPGYFVSPAIVSRPPENSRLVQEEPFGPIVPVLEWDDEEDVIRRANDTDQGLGATVWCRDPERAERIASRLEAGSVWVNRGAIPLPTALFGGIKQSGIGGEWGPLGLLSYCDARTFHFSKRP